MPAIRRPAPSEQSPWWDEPQWTAPLRTATSLAQRLVRAQRASLLLPTASRDRLQVVAGIGLPACATASRVRLGEPVAGVVAQTGRPLVGGTKRRLVTTRGATYRTNAFISVPVRLAEHRFGVLNVADPLDRDAFNPDDLTALEGLATYVMHAMASTAARRLAILAQDEERRRIAQELHDELGSALNAAVFRLDLRAQQAAPEPEAARAAIAEARAVLVESITTVHDIAYALRPRVLDALGLLPALRSLAQKSSAPGLNVTSRLPKRLPPLDALVELTIFRVAQEALTNIRKHAHATRAALRLTVDAARLCLTIEDNGTGLRTAEQSAPSEGLGLLGIRERLETFGGTLAIIQCPGAGTRLIAELPWQPGYQAWDEEQR